MEKEGVILVAEDDEGHFSLIKGSLQRVGISNEILRFADGREMLDFLFMKGEEPNRQPNKEYLLLLDIRMPGIDGMEVLEKIKQDAELKKIPVIVLTVVDEARTIERCHKLGCSMYIVKPAEPESFADTVQKIGLFLSAVEIPRVSMVE